MSHLASGDKAATLDLLKRAAGLNHPRSIHARVYDWWAELNDQHFGGQLQPCMIVIGVTEYSGSLGYCSIVGDQARITLHQALISPASSNDSDKRWQMPVPWLGEVMLRDVLLHEMCHQAQANLSLPRDGGDPHHCRSWTDLINRISPAIGLENVWFPIYKRGKQPVTNPDGSKSRKNVRVVANLDECPPGARVAAFEEVGRWPYLTFDAMGLAEARYGLAASVPEAAPTPVTRETVAESCSLVSLGSPRPERTPPRFSCGDLVSIVGFEDDPEPLGTVIGVNFSEDYSTSHDGKLTFPPGWRYALDTNDFLHESVLIPFVPAQ